MYCRNCGKEINEKAEVCTSCGVPPFAEKKYCQECGVETKENQVVCVKCGVALKTIKKNIFKSASSASSGAYEGLYCSTDDKIILGFCGGLAHKFGIQTSIVRVIVVISSLFMVGWLYFIGFFLPKLPTKNI